MIKFREYLKSIAATYKSAKSMDLQVCMGNVSADMDSIVGSLVLSFLLTQYEKMLTFPIINCNKEELMFRFETYHLLFSNDLVSDLIYYNESEIKLLMKNNKVGVVLFDHNVPDTNQQYLCENVCMIMDHHADYKKFQIKDILIKQCGSCMSLAINKFESSIKDWDRSLALLTISPILVDSDNFNPELKGGKWSDVDSYAYNILMAFLPGFNNDIYNQQIKKQKHDVKANLEIGVDNLLIKDYKNYQITEKYKYGSSVISIKPKTLIGHFGADLVCAAMRKLMTTKDVNFYVLNCLCVDSHKKKREIICMSRSEKQLNKFVELLMKYQEELFLSKMDSRLVNCTMFKLKSAAITRKMLEPKFNDILSEVASL